MCATAGQPVEGEEIGPFRVVRRIGGGGMGAVFEAVDERLERRVALKVIAPGLAGDAELHERFTAEARALASLDSPHVVQVYAHGDHAGRLYIATELFPDGDLARLLEHAGPPPIRVGLGLVSQLADGVAAAHAIGLVHRDIKPANVLLRRRGGSLSASLGDFGVACRLGAEPAGEVATFGTPAWMAPELHAGAPAGMASDVYSLGCLLWATLSGRAPYAGASDDRVVAAHREQPVPQLLGDSPMAREVNRILRTALAKDPAARYRTTAGFRDDLRRAATLADAAGSGPTATTSSRRFVPVAALLAGVVAGSIAHAASGGDGGAAPSPAAVSSAGDRARAVDSLARALTDRRVMTRAEADCTARRWITRVGLSPMVAAGFFDADLEYVDQSRNAMTPRIEAAATAAARACAERG